MATQTIFGRVSQLVRANLNDLIDRAEDPEKMLDQLVRDYSNAISEARGEVATITGALRLSEEDLSEKKELVREWGNKAKVASRKADEAEESGDEAEAKRLNNLAHEALKLQISVEAEVKTLTDKIAADTPVVEGLKDGLTKMEGRLNDLKSKRQSLIARAKMAQAQATVQNAVSAVNATDPTSELSRFEDRIRLQEAKVRGQAELASESLEAQFASLDDDAAETEAAERLAALKEKASVV